MLTYEMVLLEEDREGKHMQNSGRWYVLPALWDFGPPPSVGQPGGSQRRLWVLLRIPLVPVVGLGSFSQ